MKHMFDITCSDDTRKVYCLAMGVTVDELSEGEKRILEESEAYLKEKHLRNAEETVKKAKHDFEILRDLPGMPIEAIMILKKWTTRDGDEDEYEDEHCD